MKKSLAFIFPIALSLLVGWFSYLVQAEALREWYSGLEKPAWMPPAALFPIARVVLCVLLGLAAGWVIVAPGRRQRLLLRLWFLLLLTGFCWSVLFFWFRSPAAGLAFILLLDVLTAAFIVKGWTDNRAAAILLLPFAVWIGWVTYLDVWILFRN